MTTIGGTANDVPQMDEESVVLHFSDDVVGGASLTAKIRDTIELNGAPARLIADDTAVVHGETDGQDPCQSDKVTVTFLNGLNAGDVISIAGGTKIGTGQDERSVSSSSVTVPAPPVDRARPSVSALGIIGVTDADDALQTFNGDHHRGQRA